MVEVLKAFIKEDDKTQREEIESKIETGTKVPPAIKKTCEATFIDYSRKHRSFHNDSGLSISLSTSTSVIEKPNTNANLALQVGIKRKNETREPHLDPSSPTYSPPSTAKH